MGGASGIGSAAERARQAMAAGCDVLPLCNDRLAVLEALDELAGKLDPVSQVRLIPLHGKPMPARAELFATQRWQKCRAAIDHCHDTPSLRLDA